MEDVEVLWLGYGGVHPAHRILAESVDADVKVLEIEGREGYHNIFRYVWNGFKQHNYDVIICNEGAAARSAISLKFLEKMIPFRKATTVFRYFANANLYFISQGHGKREFSDLTLAKLIDGGIANSEFTMSYAKKETSGPVKKVLPPMEQEKYDKLISQNPDFGSKKILSVGNSSWYKGKDLLVEAFEEIRENHPESELILVGDQTKQYSNKEGVKAKGYVDSVVEEFSNVDVYVQPSRADGFGLTVTEAMRAGIPPVVTETVGASELVSRVDEGLIAEPSAQSLSDAVSEYFKQPEAAKEEYSEKCRELSEAVNPEARRKEFAKKFESLLKELGKI